MSRMPRPDPIGGWHHVMSRGVNREAIFRSDEDRLVFGGLLARAVGRARAEVHAYCLMGNHFHLLLRCPEAGVSDTMHSLLSPFARYVNETHGRTGHLFGDRFCSRLIVDERYLANVVRYIHRNPLDVTGVDDVAAYRWSSHRTYLRLRPRPEWMRLDPVSSWFGTASDFDDFVRSSMRREEPFPVSAAAIVDTIDQLLAELSDAPSRHVPAQRSAALLTILDRADETTSSAMVERLGLGPAALKAARSRARALRRSEPLVEIVVEKAAELLDPEPPIAVPRAA